MDRKTGLSRQKIPARFSPPRPIIRPSGKSPMPAMCVRFMWREMSTANGFSLSYRRRWRRQTKGKESPLVSGRGDAACTLDQRKNDGHGHGGKNGGPEDTLRCEFHIAFLLNG